MDPPLLTVATPGAPDSPDRAKRSKHKFTPEEDAQIRQFAALHGVKQWDLLAQTLPDRSARQIRDRWAHYLSPQVSAKPWSLDEDRQLLRLCLQNGTQWSVLVKHFPGRTDINLKNRWNKLQRRSKKVIPGGVMPGPVAPHVICAEPTEPTAHSAGAE
jgi:hypothetical protein